MTTVAVSVRALDSDHDWTFGAGLSNYFYNNAAIAQNINTRLNSFLGDCFFDLGAGIDWLNLLGGKDLFTLNLSISTVITNTLGVTGLLQLNSNLDAARNFSVSYKVQTVYSTVTSTFIFDQSIGG